MTSYIERLSHVDRQRSSAAVWCQRLAVFAVPFLLIVVLGHRFGFIDTIPTLWLLGLGGAIVALALIFGVRGFYELWTYGHQAGMNSARGMVLASILALPFIYMAGKAFILPPLYDISTDLEDPPGYDMALDDRSETMNPVVELTSVASRLQLEAYPRVTARRYPLGIGRVFREIVTLVGERDWTLLTANIEQGNAPIDEEGSGLVAKNVADSRGRPLRIPKPSYRPSTHVAIQENEEIQPFESVQVAPTGREGSPDNGQNDERYVEAVATSLVFGFESDVVIRMVEEEEGTLVDMRSTSRWGPHDFGSNSQRILDFMTDLDTALQGLGQGT